MKSPHHDHPALYRTGPLQVTLALIKPDAVQRGVVGQILTDFIEPNFIIGDISVTHWDDIFMRDFYEEHSERAFYPDLVKFMTSGPAWALTLVAPNAVTLWRSLMGATDARYAEPNTVRGRFGNKEGIVMRNAVHGSDTSSRAKEEVALVARSLYAYRFGEGADIVQRSLGVHHE